MNAVSDLRAFAGTTLVTLLATVAFGCLVASPPAVESAGWNTTVALHATCT